MRRTFVRRSEGRPQSRHRPTPKAPAKSAHDRTRTCTPFPTLVPQTSLSTNSSTWAQTPSCSGRDSNPHEVNPHRVLNPARLPIPPPERARAYFTRTSGAEGNRTPDLLNAIQALSQLSYGPNTHSGELRGAFRLPARFQSTASGADETRTRDLRCDRPAL